MGKMSVDLAISARRARRVLSEEPIGSSIVDGLIEAMRLSPSCYNNQPWNVIVVRSPDALEAVKANLPRGNSWALSSPLVLAIISKAPDDCQLSDGRDYNLFDCGIAVGEMLLQATSLGIIAHPIAGYDPIATKKVLGVPEEYTLITLVICGHPGSDTSMLSEKQLEQEGQRPARKPVGQNFHEDLWGSGF